MKRVDEEVHYPIERHKRMRQGLRMISEFMSSESTLRVLVTSSVGVFLTTAVVHTPIEEPTAVAVGLTSFILGHSSLVLATRLETGTI